MQTSHLFNHQSFSFARDSCLYCSAISGSFFTKVGTRAFWGAVCRQEGTSCFFPDHSRYQPCDIRVQLVWVWLCELRRQGPIVVRCPGFRSGVLVVLLLGGHSVDSVPLRKGLNLSISQLLHFKSEDGNNVLAQCLVPNNCSLCGIRYCQN